MVWVCVLLKKVTYILDALGVKADKHQIFIFGWTIPLMEASITDTNTATDVSLKCILALILDINYNHST